MEPILITSALPYVNAIPHLGNLIGSTLSGDVYARYMKQKGHKVLYLCGTDEYGTTTEIKAKKENMTCQEICDKYHKLHKMVYDWFNIDFDIFGRTTTETQTELTHEIFLELYKNGFIEQKEISQRYCELCEMFLADRYLKGNCYVCGKIANGDQCDNCNNLLDPLLFKECWCITCSSNPIIKQTKHLYIKLGEFEETIREHFITNNKVKMTENAFQITKSFLEFKNGLESRCITRDLKWGTPVPTSPEFPELEEFKDKVFYVWFDAPIGYLSILKHGIENKNKENKTSDQNENWKNWLQGQIIQFMAKDNVSFHTVIFPATLLGSNKYPLLTGLSATEYLDFEGTKFSKSNGTGIFGDEVMQISKELGIDEDYWRYYLMRIRPETKDSSFNWTEFAMLAKGELSNKLGNYINRCVTLSYKFFGSSENNDDEANKDNEIEFEYNPEYDSEITAKIENDIKYYHECFNKFKLRDAQNVIFTVADTANTFLQKNKPWDLCKDNTNLAEGRKIMGYANNIVCILIELMKPFMPKKSESLSKNFIKTNNKVTINKNNYNILFKIFESPKNTIKNVD
ncbi:MAG: methionyl-tRNA synthetase [Terrestrivirus sp.]|uniref:methionine--tRNA ligase n=1 Tax=Terrestrivirus sp. TaxID=2487775 RepID=A0A3G4ZM28_9VIRU|nr:MAG: methionyl-tRNA synthetase [Terrestrivirus sp.]